MDGARKKYTHFNVIEAMIPRHVFPGHEEAPFKLACDDFQLTNMVINDKQGLKVIAVIDWEWPYTASAWLVNSTPSWLLIETPNKWSSVDVRVHRLTRYLDLYSRILEG